MIFEVVVVLRGIFVSNTTPFSNVMKTFKDDMIHRGWWLRSVDTKPPTHLLLNGGRLCVPDEHAGVFLNAYFNAILRGELVCLVELKTPIFRMFLDIDARMPLDSKPTDFEQVFACIADVAKEFWILENSLLCRMIVCSASTKQNDDNTLKYGFHIVFPNVYVNAPIAMAFRECLVEQLNTRCAHLCQNTWEDVIDPCVFKANGLRAVYSAKGVSEGRAYVPWLVTSPTVADTASDTTTDAADAVTSVTSVTSTTFEFLAGELPPNERREYVHECSIRVFGCNLTPCTQGQDTIADKPHMHATSGVVIGRAVSLDAYADVLPKVQKILPDVYENQRFVGVFKTNHAVMLRSSSRYCQNVGREHRTSTVYFAITRKGVSQRCYCRKDTYDCNQYISEQYPLDKETIAAFVPIDDFKEDGEPQLLKLPSKKKHKSLDDLLTRSRFSKGSSSKKRKKK